MILALEGLLAGAAHVLSGPDHLVGVAPLAVERTRSVRPWVLGLNWGIGHGVGVALLGVLGQTLLSSADVEVASFWAERLVGIVLIVLGLNAIRRARGLVLHEHLHTHDGDTHGHLHVHEHLDDSHSAGKEKTHGHRHAALGIGLVHGLAGAGHFWVVLPSLAMSPSQAAVFIASYIGASVLAMAIFGGAIGKLAHSVGSKGLRRLFTSIGAITVAVGVAWLVLTWQST
ncbi:MAG: ABC-type nickel/cobalt efflux system permease component RcnA [Planctomycetota bacterium]|jgi:ABC-type nickel/cobalt efflux system permease component RcnA